MKQTLVQRTNTATEQDFVTVSCECGSPLIIPAKIYKKLEHSRESPEVAPLLGRQHQGFYISPEKHLLCGSLGYFCNKLCLDTFTDS